MGRYKAKIIPGTHTRATVIKDARKEFLRIAGAPVVSSTSKSGKGAGGGKGGGGNGWGKQKGQNSGQTHCKSFYTPARQREVALLSTLTVQDANLVFPHVPSNARVVHVAQK